MKKLNFLLLLFTCTGINAQLCFKSPDVYKFKSSFSQTSLCTADFNGDGNLDLAAAGSSDSVAVMYGNSSGGFANALKFKANAAHNDLIATDLNGDGKSDIALVSSSSDSVTLLFGNGSGGFGPPANFGSGYASSSIISGDFNSDGITDLAVGGFFGVYIHLGTGTGSFGSKIQTNLPDNSYHIAKGNLNGDNKLDLVVSKANIGKVSVLAGLGNGTFTVLNSYTTGANPGAITCVDINNDGKTDVVVANRQSNNVSILTGDGNGALSSAFTLALQQNASFSPHAISCNDFNSDGKQDIAIVHSSSTSSVSLLLSNGQGGFNPVLSYSLGNGQIAVQSGDYDADGRIDMVVNNSDISGNIATVLLQCNLPTSISGRDKITSALNIYPIPAENQITIECPEPTSIIVTNLFGETMLQQQLEQGKNCITLLGLPPAIYIIKSNSDSFKIIKL